MLSIVLTAVLAQGISVQEQFDGTEIGDEKQYIAFNSGGAYIAEREDGNGKAAGKTVAKGTWSVKDQQLEVKILNCKGPACGELGKPYTAQVAIVAERAMTVKSSLNPGPLSSGSYYCRFQGCEKRTGVLLVTHGARAATMKYVLDYLIDQNRKRDITVVWWGKKTGTPGEASQITWCARDLERGKKGAEQAAQDLGELPWFGKVTPAAATETDCLYDVKIVVGDKVALPPKR